MFNNTVANEMVNGNNMINSTGVDMMSSTVNNISKKDNIIINIKKGLMYVVIAVSVVTIVYRVGTVVTALDGYFYEYPTLVSTK